MEKLKNIALLYRTRWFFSLVAIFIFLAVALIVQELNGFREGGIGLCDFEVYYRAGGRLLHAENLFRPIEDGHFSFKYSPTAALFFIPFALLPLVVAKMAFWLFLDAAIVLGLYLSMDIVNPRFREDPRRTNKLILLAFLILLPHIWTEFGYGQVNYLLLVAYIGVAWLFIHRKAAACSALLAFTVFVKPYGLILLPYFIYKRRFREAGGFVAFTSLFYLLPAVFYRSIEFAAQQRAWLQSITDELGVKSDLLAPGNHTIFAMLARFSPLNAFPPDAPLFRVYTLILLTAIGLAALWVFHRGKRMENSEALDFALIFALMPLISYTTDNAFGFTELAVVLLLFNYSRMSTPERRVLTIALIFVAFDLFFFNRFDFGGSTALFEIGDAYSLLGIGTLLLILIMSRNRMKARL